MIKFLLAFFLIVSVAHGNSYLVKFKDSESLKSMHGVQRVIPELNIAIMDSIPKSLNGIEYVENNSVYSIPPVIRSKKYQGALKPIKAEKAWGISNPSNDIIVAVIDTGVDYTHKDLKANAWVNEGEIGGNGKDDDGNGYVDDVYGYDFANNDSDPMDDHAHGTHCAGVIGALHNDFGIKGVNPNVKIMAIKFLTKYGSGSLEGAVKSIMYAVKNGAHVLSNSWGGGGPSQAISDAIYYAEKKGVIFVAAAGNSGSSRKEYPASHQHSNIISVAATDNNDGLAYFSNYGIPHVDLAAPGVGVMSTVPGNKYESMSGTSMATPFVSGAVSLLLANENIEYKEAIHRVLWSTDVISGLKEKVVTTGRLNLFNMLQNITRE